MERIKIIKPKLRGLMLVALAVGQAAHAQVGVELSDRAQALYQDVQYSVGMQSNLGRATYCLSTYAQSLAACEVGGMPVAIPVGVCDAYTGGSQYSAQPCGSTALQALNVGYAVLDAINSEGQGYETILRHYEPISYAIQRVGEVYSGATQPVPPAPYPPSLAHRSTAPCSGTASGSGLARSVRGTRPGTRSTSHPLWYSLPASRHLLTRAAPACRR